MAEPPKIRLTLTEARERVAARFSLSVEEAQEWLMESIRYGDLKLWDHARGSTIASVAGYDFDWPRSEITKTTRRPTYALTEDIVDPQYKNDTDTREVRIKWHELKDVLTRHVEPREPPAEAAPGKPGRKPKWDWKGANRFMMELANSPNGLPETQAEIEREVADWFVKNYRNHPSESMIRDFVSENLPANYRSSTS